VFQSSFKRAGLIFWLLCLPVTLWAQDGLFFKVGIIKLNLEHLNRQLTQQRYSALDETFAIYSFLDIVVEHKRLFFDMESIELQENTSVSDQYKFSLGGNIKMLNVGYVTKRWKNLDFYPHAGLGYASLSLEVYPDDLILPGFNTVLASPETGITLKKSSLIFNIGTGAHFVLPVGKLYGVLGAHIGYMGTLAEWNWRYQGVRLTGAPYIGLSGPYIQFLVGIGVDREEMDGNGSRNKK